MKKYWCGEVGPTDDFGRKIFKDGSKAMTDRPFDPAKPVQTRDMDAMTLQAEIDGVRFKLRLNADGNPYILKRLMLNEPRSREYWGTVWAEWHKGKPTGIRARAIELMGFVWDNSHDPCRWRRIPRTMR